MRTSGDGNAYAADIFYAREGAGDLAAAHAERRAVAD